MTKILLTLLTLAALATEASAQSRTFYDSSGKVVGRSSTDTQGTTTNYDARGKVIIRKSTGGNTTMVYDARGRMSDGSQLTAKAMRLGWKVQLCSFRIGELRLAAILNRPGIAGGYFV